MGEETSYETTGEPGARLRLLESIVGNTRDAILVTEAWPVDEPGPKVVYANESFTRMTGYSSDEVVGKTPRILQGAGTDRAGLDEIRNALTEREPVRVELLNYRKDGSEFWVEVDIVPVADEHGNYTHWVSVQRDVTERRNQEEALSEGEERFRTVIQVAEDIITFMDGSGNATYVSPASERILGYSPEELVGSNVFEYLHPEDEVKVRERLAEVLQGPQVLRVPIEFRFRRKDGSYCVLETTGTNQLSNPALGTIVMTSRDVTERKLTERALAESERRFRSVVANSSEVVKITDADGTLKYASPAFERLFGYSPEEVIGTNVFDYAHPEDIPRIQEETEKALESPGVGSNMVEYRFRHKNGSWRWVESVGTYLLDDPAVEGVVINARDVTERKRIEKELCLKDRAVSASSNGMIITDPNLPDNPIIYINPAFERITGYTSEETIGRNCRFLRDFGEEQPNLAELRHALKEEREWSGTLRNYRKDGTVFYNELYIAPVHDGDGQLTNFIGVQKDVTERRRLEEDLQYRATHDPLTGLANRRLLFASLEKALRPVKSVQQQSEAICLLYMDLDGFKEVNDRHGHEAGDALLAAVARRIEGCLRPSDMAARVGGDEFCVLLEGASATEEAERVAERLVYSLGAPFSLDTSIDTTVGNLVLEISASVGIVAKDKDSGISTPDELMREADAAMYRTKSRGDHSAAWSR